MNLEALRYLVAVADFGGVTAAARRLGVSQPAVSRAVRHLEEHTEIPLLERTGRGVRLTGAGSALVAHGRALFASERLAEESLAALRGLERGALHVGASTTIAHYILPPVVARFLERHPGITFRLSAVHTRELVERLLRYEIDVALAEAPVQDERIIERPWKLDELVVIAAPTHPLARRRRIPPKALAAELVLLREPESRSRQLILQALAAAGVTLGRTVTVDGTEAIKHIVASGRGLGIVSRVAVAEQVQLGSLTTLDLRDLRIHRTLHRLELRDRVPSRAADAFNQLLRSAPQKKS